MATSKIERAGVGFGIGRQAGSIIIDVRPHHDTISALRGVQVGFELLNGITLEQAKKILDVLNEKRNRRVGHYRVGRLDGSGVALTKVARNSETADDTYG